MKGEERVFSSNSDLWTTPQDLYDWANSKWGPFTIDAAASKENTLCSKYFTEEDNALVQDWVGGNIFCNPPYSLSPEFIKKACEESLKSPYAIILLIAARTSNEEWHKYIFPYASEICFIDGRVKFGNTKAGAPFPSVFVIFDREKFLLNGCKPKLSTHSVRKCRIKSTCKPRGSKKRSKSLPTT